ncbi:hypothetical protein [Methanobrevibacter sp.]|uniref:hypothetical protein n=1 Tax=Methanobrevibacter sp. TaxID=66852 RepID=UPI00262C6DC1|nr:hypothetical protein [uncultured Methanobrevibacter sp.]
MNLKNKKVIYIFIPILIIFNSSLKIIVIGLIVLFLAIMVKNLFLPRGGISALLSIIIAVIVGLFIVKKIKKIKG